MSEGFHVHGVHEHAVEHQAHSGDSFAARIAVMTAILSTVGALFSFQGGAEQNVALLEKNEAAIKQAEASDQWAYYQAKGNKQNLAELGAAMTTGDIQANFAKEAARYQVEKARSSRRRVRSKSRRPRHPSAAKRRCTYIIAGRRR